MRPRGFTLAEVLVASSLSLVLLGLVTSVWVLASKGWSKTYQTQTAQQSTLVAATRFREDFRHSRPESASIQGPVLSFLSFDDGSGQNAWDTTGSVIWKCWIQYRWAGGRLERRQTSLINPSADPTGPAPAWAPDIPGYPLGQQLVLCDWRLERQLVLDLVLQSKFEGQVSDSHLRVLPTLYQPD